MSGFLKNDPYQYLFDLQIFRVFLNLFIGFIDTYYLKHLANLNIRNVWVILKPIL